MMVNGAVVAVFWGCSSVDLFWSVSENKNSNKSSNSKGLRFESYIIRDLMREKLREMQKDRNDTVEIDRYRLAGDKLYFSYPVKKETAVLKDLTEMHGLQHFL